jgi:hypothetical protein
VTGPTPADRPGSAAERSTFGGPISHIASSRW